MQVKRKTIGKAAYWLLVLCLVFTLGYLLGTGRGETNLTLQTLTTQTGAENAAEDKAQAQEKTAQTAIDSSHRLNINQATQEELDQLPGIGPELAKRIVDYKHKHGPFATIRDLKNVEGIGEKRFEQIKSLITVGG